MTPRRGDRARRRDRRGDRAAGVRRPRERLRRRPGRRGRDAAAAPSTRVWRAPRSRTTPAARTTRSTTSASPPSGWPRRPRPRTPAPVAAGAHRAGREPPARRRRPRRHDRPPAGLPGGRRRRALRTRPRAASRTSARSSRRSTGRSTSSPCPEARRCAELAAVGVRRVSVGGAFAFAALGARSKRRASCSTRGPTATWSGRGSA